MLNIKLFSVNPKIPSKLAFLERLSYNMWWCWHYDAIELFRRIDTVLWYSVGGNARQFLNLIPQSTLEELAHDKGFLSHLKRVEETFQRQVGKNLRDDPEHHAARRIAYFSLEFGIHESIRLYSGGLGVLAGDHLKAASDMNLPLVGVGLLYRQGYFRQFLDRNGWQNERYPENEIGNMPISRARDREQNEISVTVQLLDQQVIANVWVLQVGNIPLYLLDTEIPENPPELRRITWRLYGSDRKMRLHQELLLGIGGYKALVALGHEPASCHINEGHAAFLSLARIDHLVKSKGIDPETARAIVWRSNIFTTHTPVPAGNEVFDIDLVKPYFEALASEMSIDPNQVIAWGQGQPDSNQREISMTVLGLRMANFSNGVSKLHGEVARNMWSQLWPDHPADEVPIGHVTNGVHVASWISERKKLIFDHYLGPDWLESPYNDKVRNMIDSLPDEELWHAHEVCRLSLVKQARRRLEKQKKYINAPSRELGQVKNVLNQEALTVGFARRFATYKRANLLLSDPKRLEELLTNPERPVQIIFAGKAHPADDAGKSLIQKICEFAKRPSVQGHIVFLEDYDIGLARYMVQGVDVWLNTPLRPMEASGTSGMKAAVNGVMNCSILDGWWDEGYSRECGWAIASNDSYVNGDERDRFEAMSLFNLLETEIIPRFYERSSGEIPVRWVRMMKESFKMALEKFTSYRMVSEYNSKFYEKAIGNFDAMCAKDAELAKTQVEARKKYEQFQNDIKIDDPQVNPPLTELHVGDSVKVQCVIHLGRLQPDDIEAQAYFGPVDTQNQITRSYKHIMDLKENLGNNSYLYEYEMVCKDSGRFGVTVRVKPHGDVWDNYIPGFLKWATN